MAMKLWQKNLGSSLTATSLAILGSSVALGAAGASKTILLWVAILGVVTGVVGVFFSHLFAVDQAAAVAANAAGVAQGAAIDKATGNNLLPSVTSIATNPPPVSPPGSLAGVIQPNAQVPPTKQ